jgi:predicted O-methyltransferase YrrM
MLDELKQYAKDHLIPIICDDGLLFLKNAIESNGIKKVLEIGTAIGYSAIFMAKLGCQVTTFERNKEMINLAKVNMIPYENKIKLISEDALLYEGKLEAYDMIFIDAAKAQYQKFFEKFTPFLNPNGIVICDNLDFHHLDPLNVNRNTRQLIRKIEAFKKYLTDHPDYVTTFYDQGDGMSISKRVIQK